MSIRRVLATAGAMAVATTSLIAPMASAQQSSSMPSVVSLLSKSTVVKSSALSVASPIGSEKYLKILTFGVTTPEQAAACAARYPADTFWGHRDCSVEVITEEQYLDTVNRVFNFHSSRSS